MELGDYIADTSNHRIRKVSTDGMVTTVAGNGIGGFSGDGSAASRATLNSPSGGAVDAAGNLYIADSFNNRIRKLNNIPSVHNCEAGHLAVISQKQWEVNTTSYGEAVLGPL